MDEFQVKGGVDIHLEKFYSCGSRYGRRKLGCGSCTGGDQPAFLNWD